MSPCSMYAPNALNRNKMAASKKTPSQHQEEEQEQPIVYNMETRAPPNFLIHAEFYKSLFASAVLQQKQQQHQHYQQQQQQQQQFMQQQHANDKLIPGAEQDENITTSQRLYAQSPARLVSPAAHFPRNFMFANSPAAAVAAAAAAAAVAESVKRSRAEEECRSPKDNESNHKPSNYSWSANESHTKPASKHNPTHLPNSAPATPTPPASNLNLDSATQGLHVATAKAQSVQEASCDALHSPPPTCAASSNNNIYPTSKSQAHITHSLLQQCPTSVAATMPIGGVQGQNPTQGLVHWMSAVMAEHMTGQTHHDPSAVGMHYMWNGNVDCGQHTKEIGDYNGWPPTPRSHMSMKQGYEAKMNDHHNNLQKGHFLDDNRLDHHAGTPQGNQMAALYGCAAGSSPATSTLRAVALSNRNSPAGGGAGLIGGAVGPHHGNHVGHHSSAAAALLVVPQPINATKISGSLGVGGPGGGGGSGGAGTGRKYQCKMCPQLCVQLSEGLEYMLSYGMG